MWFLVGLGCLRLGYLNFVNRRSSVQSGSPAPVFQQLREVPPDKIWTCANEMDPAFFPHMLYTTYTNSPRWPTPSTSSKPGGWTRIGAVLTAHSGTRPRTSLSYIVKLNRPPKRSFALVKSCRGSGPMLLSESFPFESLNRLNLWKACGAII